MSMSIRVIVVDDYDCLSETAAGLLLRDCRARLRGQRGYVLGLATGSTPVGLYKHLAAASAAGRFDPRRVRTFNLDEYVGLPGENAQQRALHPESYGFFMVAELFGLLRRKFAESSVPAGAAIDQRELQRELAAHPADWREVGADSGRAIIIRPRAASPFLARVRREILDGYARKIERAGGVDLQVIGVGGRGHVAFHEAGVPFDAGAVLLVRLDRNTIANAVADGHFASPTDAPRFAVTMSASLVFQARTVMMLAAGERKREPVLRALLDEPSPALPISHGQVYARSGGRLVCVVDRVVGEALLARRRALRAKGVEMIDRRAKPPARRLADLCFYRDPHAGFRFLYEK
jgi:glucosamine-6-phosphate deaminase